MLACISKEWNKEERNFFFLGVFNQTAFQLFFYFCFLLFPNIALQASFIEAPEPFLLAPTRTIFSVSAANDYLMLMSFVV